MIDSESYETIYIRNRVTSGEVQLVNSAKIKKEKELNL